MITACAKLMREMLVTKYYPKGYSDLFYLLTELALFIRLYKQLNQGKQSKLTVVSAPVGSGKTTLLAEWIQTLSWPTAWISLAESDDSDSF